VGLHGSERQHGNLYPAKQRPEQKIDAAVALMIAVGRAMAVDETRSIYEERDLILI
jgi:phage terminase large subunit-like protein